MAKYKIIVESEPGKGCTFDVAAPGAGIGRSAKNDISIPDELLSRHHCKIYFKGEEAWIADLATLNGTGVNGQIITEDVKLNLGDTISIGDTVLRFTAENGSFPAGAAGAGATPPQKTADTPVVPGGPVDLGFNGSGSEADAAKYAAHTKKNIIRIAVAFVAICLVAIALNMFLSDKVDTDPVTPLPPQKARTLEINYTKTEATTNNIFKYEMTLDSARFLTVAIDDITQGRHVRKTTDAPISEDALYSLIRKFDETGFQDMPANSDGIPPANTWNAASMTAIIDGEVKTVIVRNKIDPAAFKKLREDIEAFGRSELGLWAVEYSSDKLMDLAYEQLIVARKNSDARDIRLDNLHAAIQAYKSSIAYLETIEPKPGFYDEAVLELATAESDLDTTYKDKSWQADHAINTRGWETAAATLRDLLQVIPDRSDDRNKEITRKLLEVEARIREIKR